MKKYTCSTPESDSVISQSYGEDCVIHFAMRYALGRTTAASSIVCGELTRNWHLLRPGTRGQIQREIKEAIAANRAGEAMDVAEWEKILHL